MAKVLLVLSDDRESRLLCGMLEKLGHHCLGVYTGEGALHLLQTQSRTWSFLTS